MRYGKSLCKKHSHAPEALDDAIDIMEDTLDEIVLLI